MSIHSDLQALETRMTGLRALIARRESQTSNVQHEGAYSDTSKHIAAARAELRGAAADYIALKVGNGGGWEPLEVIERMKGPKHDAGASVTGNQALRGSGDAGALTGEAPTA